MRNSSRIGLSLGAIVVAVACGNGHRRNPEATKPIAQATAVPTPTVPVQSNERDIWVSERSVHGFQMTLLLPTVSGATGSLQVRRNKVLVSEGNLRLSFVGSEVTLEPMDVYEAPTSPFIVGKEVWNVEEPKEESVRISTTLAIGLDEYAMFGLVNHEPSLDHRVERKFRKLTVPEYEREFHSFNCAITPDSSGCETYVPTGNCSVEFFAAAIAGQGENGLLRLGDWFPVINTEPVSRCRLIPPDWQKKIQDFPPPPN